MKAWQKCVGVKISTRLESTHIDKVFSGSASFQPENTEPIIDGRWTAKHITNKHNNTLTIMNLIEILYLISMLIMFLMSIYSGKLSNFNN